MKHISKKRQPVDGLLMILIFSLVFSGLFQVVLAFSNQGVADVMTFNYVWATTPIDNIFHLYSIPSLDYPPLVPVLFRLITPVLQYFSASASTFLLMKLFPIAFNLILGIAVYVIVDKKQPLSDMDKALAVVVATFSPTLHIQCSHLGPIRRIARTAAFPLLLFGIDETYLLGFCLLCNRLSDETSILLFHISLCGNRDTVLPITEDCDRNA